jgi:hypothetical protein
MEVASSAAAVGGVSGDRFVQDVRQGVHDGLGLVDRRYAVMASRDTLLENYRNAWNGLRIREAIDTLGPPSALLSEDGVLRSGAVGRARLPERSERGEPPPCIRVVGRRKTGGDLFDCHDDRSGDRVSYANAVAQILKSLAK